MLATAKNGFHPALYVHERIRTSDLPLRSASQNVVMGYLVDYTSPFFLINTRFFCSIWSSLVCLCRGLFKKSGGNLLAELTFGVWLDVNTPAINRLPFPILQICCQWEWCSIFSYQITIILLESCAFVYYPLATWRFSSRTWWRQQFRVSRMPSSCWKKGTLSYSYRPFLYSVIYVAYTLDFLASAGDAFRKRLSGLQSRQPHPICPLLYLPSTPCNQSIP